MAEEATIMAEEMQSPKKVAFANRKYTNEEKRKMEEEELEQLIKQQSGETEDEESTEPEEAEPTNAEEKTFKKRYSDLRRHQQKQAEEFKAELENLKSQLSAATKKEMKLPKSDEDIEEWAKEYPDVAAIVETIAVKKAREQASELENRIKAIDELQYSATKEKAEAQLMQMHPDFDEIRDSDDFHDWAEEQPKWYRMHCTIMTMTQDQQQEPLTSTKSIEELAKSLRARAIRVQQRQLRRKIKEVSRRAMKLLHI